MSAVQIDGVWKYFGNYPALRDVTLCVQPGTCLALLGRNGAGKTTLLRILAGLSHPARGRVTLGGREARDLETRRQVGVLGHAIGIYDELSARENLRLFAKLYGAAPAIDEWLARVGLQQVADVPARSFSRGMRQRLAVARAFLHQPRVLLLDEPFTSLDDRSIALLQELLREALMRGAAVVLSTHQLREALDLASHVALMGRGSLLHTGERTAAMLADPGLLYREYGDAA